MKIELLSEPGANPKRERVTLDANETAAVAGSTRKHWRGPGPFHRSTWTDGAREDHVIVEGGARLVDGPLLKGDHE